MFPSIPKENVGPQNQGGVIRTTRKKWLFVGGTWRKELKICL